MTSESEHCCRGENLGDALLQQQEVGRRGRARGLRFGFVAIALGILPFPSWSPFFFLGGMLRSRGPRRTRGAMQHRSIPSPCVSENSVRPDPVGFPAEVKKAPKQFRKMPIQAPAVAWQIQSRGNSTKIQTARHALRLQRLVCGLSKTREFRTLEDSKPGLLRVSARSRTHANTTRRVAVQRTRRVAHSRIRARGRIFSPFRPTRADSSPRVGVASRVSVAMSKMTEKAALLPPVQG